MYQSPKAKVFIYVYQSQFSKSFRFHDFIAETFLKKIGRMTRFDFTNFIETFPKPFLKRFCKN